ncbi:interferon gamma receptor 2 [Aulostomus maculatus]
MLRALLCLHFVVQVLSETSPPPPKDVYVENQLLQWTGATQDTDVNYTVKSCRFHFKTLMNVPECVHTPICSCNISLITKGAEHGCVTLAVQAERHGLNSTLVEACSRQAGSCTPEVRVTARPGSLTVHLKENDSMNLEYGGHVKRRVYFGKEGEPLQKYEDTLTSVSVPELEEGQHYCASVQYTYFNKPVGLASCPQCEVIPESRTSTQKMEVTITVVVVFIMVVLVPLLAFLLIFKSRNIKECLRSPWQPDEFFQTLLQPTSLTELGTVIPSRCTSVEHVDTISSIAPEERQGA